VDIGWERDRRDKQEDGGDKKLTANEWLAEELKKGT